MASAAYQTILDIQVAELHIDQLRHRLANHPLRSDLASAADEIAVHQGVEQEIEAQRMAVRRDQKRLQDEVATIEARRSGVDGKLYGGEVTAAKELVALQDEAASLRDRQREIEDQEIELMESVEQLDTRSAAVVVEMQPASERHQEIADELAEAETEIVKQIAEAEAERDALEPQADPELLATYRRLRSEYDGAPLARFVNGSCDGCHMKLSAVAVDRMGKLPDDAVVSCEECGRLLVR